MYIYLYTYIYVYIYFLGYSAKSACTYPPAPCGPPGCEGKFVSCLLHPTLHPVSLHPVYILHPVSLRPVSLVLTPCNVGLPALDLPRKSLFTLT